MDIIIKYVLVRIAGLLEIMADFKLRKIITDY